LSQRSRQELNDERGAAIGQERVTE
jgi:hypothetical protein